MRITSVGYIFVYRSSRLAARLKWLWQDFDRTPRTPTHTHTRFSTLIERWMNGNEWMRNFTCPHSRPFPGPCHMQDCSFLIAAPRSLHLYLNVFKRPTIWELRRCQWQSCGLRTPGLRTPLICSPSKKPRRIQSQSEGSAPEPSCLCVPSALALALALAPSSGCSGWDKSKYVALVAARRFHFGFRTRSLSAGNAF